MGKKNFHFAVIYIIPVSASASWFKWAKSESENVPVKELLLKLAELDCFWVQSFREYTNQVRAHIQAGCDLEIVY